MSSVNGIVKKLLTTPWNGKLLHGFILENDDRMFGTGTQKAFGVNPGVSISFVPVRNDKGRWNVDAKAVEVKEQVRAPQAPQQVFETKEAKESYWEVKERVAEFSFARRDAMALADLLLKHDAVKMPAKKDKYEVILELVNHHTKEFLVANEEIRNPKPTEEAPGVETSAEVEAPEIDEWK